MVIGAPQFRGHLPTQNVNLSLTLEQSKLYKASNGENIAPNEQFNIQECISRRKSTENAIISCVFTFIGEKAPLGIASVSKEVRKEVRK